jgi:hypothetical protein
LSVFQERPRAHLPFWHAADVPYDNDNDDDDMTNPPRHGRPSVAVVCGRGKAQASAERTLRGLEGRLLLAWCAVPTSRAHTMWHNALPDRGQVLGWHTQQDACAWESYTGILVVCRSLACLGVTPYVSLVASSSCLLAYLLSIV